MLTGVAIFSRALMMGLAWAAVWVPAGMIVGALIVGELEPEHIGGPLYTGVVCGAIFAAVAGVASGRRRLAELSLPEALTWGALSGSVCGVLPFVLGEGDTTDSQALWGMLIVGISALAAGVAASRRRLGRLSGFQGAMLAVAVSGLFAGTLQAVLNARAGSEATTRFLAVWVLASLTLLSGPSAVVSRWVARSVPKDSPAAPVARNF